MTERNRISYSWSSDEEPERSHNAEQSNILNFHDMINASSQTGALIDQPSTSGHSTRNSNSVVDAFSALQCASDTNVSLPTSSNRTRNEVENTSRHHNRPSVKNRTHGSNRVVIQHRTPSRSTSLSSESRQNCTSQHIKKMLILRKAALIDRRYGTSILKNYSTSRRNISSTSGTRHTSMGNNLSSAVASRTDVSIELIKRNSPQPLSVSNSRNNHSNCLSPILSANSIGEENVLNQQSSSTLHNRSNLLPCYCSINHHNRPTVVQSGGDQSEDRMDEDHAPASQAMSADLALEEEVIEIVADDANDNVATNIGNESTTPSSSDNTVTILHGQQSANKSRQCRSLGTDRPSVAEQTKVSEINQTLLRLLECPVCLEFMEPPMSQCRRGHLVCSACRGRIISCPICRTAFSSVRNRAMEAVSDIVKYPCRHGCGRETRLRRREIHEANCANRTYSCPVVSCSTNIRYPYCELQSHYQDKHASLLRQGENQTFTLKLNQEHNEQWLLQAHNELFHVGIDITMNSWSLFLYVIYVGPKRKARNYTYEVTVVGNYNNRKMVYSRITHSDLENSSFNVGRHDCFYLSLDQAMNYIRFKNKYCDPRGELKIDLSLLCNNNETLESSDVCVD